MTSFRQYITEKSPLVHHLTNWVTIADCANITRTLGALPVMAHAEEEVQDMTPLAQALVLNIGTLTTPFINACLLAGQAAEHNNLPIVLDAVGAGATPFRTSACQQLMHELELTLIKGNAGEIATLAGHEAEVRGVESVGEVTDIAEHAASLAQATGAIVVVTGVQDIISDGHTTHTITGGHPIMGQVVGTGCMLGSVLGSFLAVAEEDTYFDAAVEALQHYGRVAEACAEQATEPLAWKTKFIDSL